MKQIKDGLYFFEEVNEIVVLFGKNGKNGMQIKGVPTSVVIFDNYITTITEKVKFYYTDYIENKNYMVLHKEVTEGSLVTYTMYSKNHDSKFYISIVGDSIKISYKEFRFLYMSKNPKPDLSRTLSNGWKVIEDLLDQHEKVVVDDKPTIYNKAKQTADFLDVLDANDLVITAMCTFEYLCEIFEFPLTIEDGKTVLEQLMLSENFSIENISSYCTPHWLQYYHLYDLGFTPYPYYDNYHCFRQEINIFDTPLVAVYTLKSSMLEIFKDDGSMEKVFFNEMPIDTLPQDIVTFLENNFDELKRILTKKTTGVVHNREQLIQDIKETKGSYVLMPAPAITNETIKSALGFELTPEDYRLMMSLLSQIEKPSRMDIWYQFTSDNFANYHLYQDFVWTDPVWVREEDEYIITFNNFDNYQSLLLRERATYEIVARYVGAIDLIAFANVEHLKRRYFSDIYF